MPNSMFWPYQQKGEREKMKKVSAALLCLFLVLSLGSSLLALVTHPVLALSGDVYVYPFNEIVASNDTTSPHGFSPATIRSVYHLPSTGGTGTIAIIDAYDDPTILNDANHFSSQFGLPSLNSTNFEKHMMASNISTAPANWYQEISLDVQWAHAIAPNAKILLVEATSGVPVLKNGTSGPLLDAVDYAASRSDVMAVSMSWGTRSGGFSTESNYDSHFISSFGATFFAASGDHAEIASWPAASPNVVGVGGTELNFNPDGSFANETVWCEGLVNGTTVVGTGGGVSQYETEPDCQASYGVPGANGHRCVPDVSYNAECYPIYTSYSGPQWLTKSGTSFGAPQWAAIMSLGLVASNDWFYRMAKSANCSSYFRDITSGSNGLFSAGSGYDFCTGLGSPLTTTYDIPPNTPTLSAPTVVVRGVSYTYSANTTDPEGDNVLYKFEFIEPGGRTDTAETDVCASGQTGSISMEFLSWWAPPGIYYVRVQAEHVWLQAQDIYGAWSGWSASLQFSVCAMLNISVGSGGTTSPAPESHSYVYGTCVTVTATPSSGMCFRSWLLDGTTYLNNPISVTMTADHLLIAYFVPQSGGGSGCVLYNTRILMADCKEMRVQAVKPGDEIMGYDVQSGAFVTETVTSNEYTIVDEILSINDGLLRVTPTEQPIYTDHGWVKNPQDLVIGWRIYDPIRNSWITIQSLKTLNGHFLVYDLRATKPDTFIGNGILLDTKDKM